MRLRIPCFAFGLWLALNCHFLSLWAQTIQDALWNVPDGKLSDLSQTFTDGNTIPLSWNALTTTAYVDTTKNLVDLWATAFDMNENSFSQRLAAGINLTSSGGTFSWTIQIPAQNLAMDAKYVLRFKTTSETFNPNNGELSSPGFLVLGAIQTSSSSSSTSSSASSSTSASSTTASGSFPTVISATINSTPSSTLAPSSTTSASQAAATTSGSSSGQLTEGAKIGIGVGVGGLLIVLGAIGIVWFLSRRRQTATPMTAASASDEKQGTTYYPAELAHTKPPRGSVYRPVELPNTRPQSSLAELGTY